MWLFVGWRLMGKICTIQGCQERQHCHGRCRYHNYHLSPKAFCSICGKPFRAMHVEGTSIIWCRNCTARENKDTFPDSAEPNPVAMLEAKMFCRVFRERGLDCDRLSRVPSFQESLRKFAQLRIGLEELIQAAHESSG